MTMEEDFIVRRMRNWQKNGHVQKIKAARDKEARKEYRLSRKKAADIHEIFILDIMREGMKHGDPRLR